MVYAGLSQSSYGWTCRLVQDGGPCGGRRGVAKAWIALVKRRTRVATDGVVSSVSWNDYRGGGGHHVVYSAEELCCHLLELRDPKK